jgi:hypothetical protein
MIMTLSSGHAETTPARRAETVMIIGRPWQARCRGVLTVLSD